tara:strand:+ start:567 stop:812 length:246 start_codon:yes stop_codon:yes gene_type:complete
MEREFTFNLKDGTTKKMLFNEFVRWACLIEGVEKVSEKLEEAGVDMNKNDWVKPLAFQKYVEERYHSMRHDLTVEAGLGNI